MTTAPVPEYTRGEWLAVVTPDCVALLAPGTPADAVQRLWASMRAVGGPALVDHLQVLAAGDLAAMAPFALLTVTGGRLHAVLRGAVEVDVTVAGRSRLLTAPHVSTWSEKVVEGAERVELRAVGVADGGEALPVASGVVRAAAVRVVVTAAARATVTTKAAVAAVALDDPDGTPVLERWPAPEPSPVPVAASRGAASAGAAATDAVPTGAVATALRPALPRSVTAGLAARPLQAAVPSPAPAPDAGPRAEPVDITLLRPAQADDAPSTDAPPSDPLPTGSLSTGPLSSDPLSTDPLSTDLVSTDLVSTDPVSTDPVSTDHDGTTVLGHEVVALRRQLPEWTGHAVVGPMAAPAPATPTPARISLSTGDVVSLSRPVLLGRAPQASRVASGQVPRLVTVPSPLQDISRTHAEVRMDGDDVVLTDLRSTNGVLVVQAGGSPQRLQPGEATVLQPGVLVDLGEGVTFTVERGA